MKNKILKTKTSGKTLNDVIKCFEKVNPRTWPGKAPPKECVMKKFVSDIAFSPTVKAEQEKRGSRTGYARMAQDKDWRNTITDDLKAFIGERSEEHTSELQSH